MRPVLVPVLLAAALLAAGPALAANESTCVFTLSMTSGNDVNNLDFEVDYSQTGGNVEGTPTKPECARALGGQAFASFRDDDENSTLFGAIIRLSYFTAPIDLVGCRIFYDSTEPVPGDFSVKVTNAGRDGQDNNVVPKPTMAVTAVECPGELPDDLTTTTTTTLPVGAACGFPVTGSGSQPAASDALFALKSAVGLGECDLCVCDVNDSGSIAAGDALAILRAAVGSDSELDCPPC